EALPHLAKEVDQIAVIRSMFNSHPNHEPALFKIHSGRLLPGLPSLGSWVVFGLGSENQNLPAYVVFDDPLGLPVNGIQNWQSGGATSRRPATPAGVSWPAGSSSAACGSCSSTSTGRSGTTTTT